MRIPILSFIYVAVRENPRRHESISTFFDLAGVDDQQLSVLWQRQLSEALSGKHHIQARVTKDIIGTFAEAVGKDALHPYFTI